MSTQDYKDQAKNMLTDWKKRNYVFGMGVLDNVGDFAERAGKSTMLVVTGWGSEEWTESLVENIKSFLRDKNIDILDIIRGARANAPREDVYRIANQTGKKRPDSIIALGGGSTIDAVKAASVLSTLDSDDVEIYFGMGLVTEELSAEGKKLPPVIAVQTAASSGAHLTKYSNITDPLTGQKKLIIDEAVIPPLAVFDYRTTIGAPYAIRADGALDGIAHCLEVVCGATGKPFFARTMDIAEVGISLIVESLPKAIDNPEDEDAIEDLGLGTDLGGYAIMVGGTNYGHLFSFSLVNKLTHGRACAIANPYVLVFFAPAIEPQLKLVGRIFSQAGYIHEDIEKYSGRDLSITVAKGMISFLEKIKFPITFGEVGVNNEDKKRIVTAAKNPQLWSKLEQAPVSLIARDSAGKIDTPGTEDNIDEYMGALIDAIISGDFDKIKNMS
ncbi:MAG: iron-containing alcohol dehydrogenase [Candidatus Aerophobetes bacterium]|nr:iron-containing alcohol dehydrogenase [Candidatus Aerophobetes bacterium]